MKIAINRTDGGVSIMTVLDDTKLNECLAKWNITNSGKYVSHHIIVDADLPPDRINRNAWRWQ